ncbi:MAG TPA: group 1 truncated hemoglobin [Aromatoleum sp.]|uniref:group I truncated hemoglobin n=1 Tax=Aromatoleum sp. TaxID=2307007 RepID=UPI002B45D555|nr:group 1 truncated hemoglobin [Aromatoleum sp.]HJV24456.1 group 1 truncated hemoglobin [Aromatoleum sp.]
MTLISRCTVAGLLALCISCGAAAADKNLYERLGGKPALTAVVNELWAVVSADQRINALFAKTKPEVFGSQLVDFLCEASGGPCKYQGKDMKNAHSGMKLTEADFNALADDTVRALDKFKVPAGEKSEVMGLLSSLKGDVVGH